MATERVELEHFAQVFHDDDQGYRSECYCGWASEWFGDNDADAEAAASDHYEVVIGPPDGLDRLINGLLDLQDDLAEAVIWLADNWTAGLPVPECYDLIGDRTALQLVGACFTHAELDQVAAVVGTAPTNDPAPNVCGHRYRRVVRDFGRVRLDIITALDREPAS